MAKTVNVLGTPIDFPDETTQEQVESYLNSSGFLLDLSKANPTAYQQLNKERQAQFAGQEKQALPEAERLASTVSFSGKGMGGPREVMGIATPRARQEGAAVAGAATRLAEDAPDILASGVGNTVQEVGQGLNFLGMKKAGQKLKDVGQETQDYWMGRTSPETQRVQNIPVYDENSGGWNFSVAPEKFVTGALQSTPDMAAAVIPSTIAIAGLTRLGTAEKIAAGAQKLGLGEKVAAYLGDFLTAGIAGGGVEGLQAGLGNSAQTEQKIRQAKAEDLVRLPAFREAYDRTDPSLPDADRVEKARDEIANMAAWDVFLKTVPTTGGIGLLTGGGATGMLSEKLAARATQKELAREGRRGLTGMIKNAAEGFGEEAVQEGLQSPAEQYIQNVAEQKYLDPETRPMAGVINSAVEGAGSGGLMGLAGGAGSHLVPTHEGATATAPVDHEAFDAVHDLPAPTGPLSRAVQQHLPVPVSTIRVTPQGQGMVPGQYAPLQTTPGMSPEEIAASRERINAPLPSQETAARLQPTEEMLLDDARDWADGEIKNGKTQLMQQVKESGDSYARRLLDAYRKKDEAPTIAAPAPPAATIRLVNPETSSVEQVPEHEVMDRLLDGWAPPLAADAVDERAHAAATSPLNGLPEPTPAQVEAGNYKKGHVRLHGLDISIENPAGSLRKGTDETGRQWSTELAHHYGYLKGTVGKDKDHVDVFIGPKPESERVYVVDQRSMKTGRLDEHKILLGFSDPVEARLGYLANYDESGPQRIGALTETTLPEFKAWLKDGNHNRPFGRFQRGENNALSQMPEEGRQGEKEVPDVRAQHERGVRGGVAGTLRKQGDILAAMASLGGLSLEQAQKEWGLEGRDQIRTNRTYFGSTKAPVFRKSANGGLSLDAMAAKLAEGGHLAADAAGKADLRELERRVILALSGKGVTEEVPESTAAAMEREWQQAKMAALKDVAADLPAEERDLVAQMVEETMFPDLPPEVLAANLKEAFDFFDSMTGGDEDVVTGDEKETAGPAAAAEEVREGSLQRDHEPGEGEPEPAEVAPKGVTDGQESSGSEGAGDPGTERAEAVPPAAVPQVDGPGRPGLPVLREGHGADEVETANKETATSDSQPRKTAEVAENNGPVADDHTPATQSASEPAKKEGPATAPSPAGGANSDLKTGETERGIALYDLAEKVPDLDPAALARVHDVILRALPENSTSLATADTITHDDPAAFAAHGVTSGEIAGMTQRTVTAGQVRAVITLAMDGATEATGYHEVYHAARMLGLLSQEDIARLEKAFPEKNGKDAEERSADAFAAYAMGKTKPLPFLRNMWDKVLAWVERIRNALSGEGYRTAHDVFADIWSGKLKGRAALDQWQSQEKNITGLLQELYRRGITPDQLQRLAAYDTRYAAKPSDVTATQQFKEWFEESQVVDKKGEPLVVYHGTKGNFGSFNAKRAGQETGNKYRGQSNFFFTDNPEVAAGYAHSDQWEMEYYKTTPNVIPVYLSLQNPLHVDAKGKGYGAIMDDVITQARKEKRDGVIIRNLIDVKKGPAVESSIFIAFSPEQIKSIFNRGTFDPTTPNISYSLADAAREAAATISPKVVLKSVGKFLNPLDYSRFRKTAENWLPTWFKAGVGWLGQTPFFKQEIDKSARPFYEEGKRREENRFDDAIAMFGGLVDDAGKPVTLKQKALDFFSWSDMRTKWEETKRENYYQFTPEERKAYDVLRFEGDAMGSEYSTLADARRNPRIRKAGVNEKVFAFYRQALAAEDHALEENIAIARRNMEEAGISAEEIEGHIAAFRAKHSEVKGWVHRDHGEGDQVVTVHHVIDRLDWLTDEVEMNGEPAFRVRLGYYPGLAIARKMEKIVKDLGGTLKQLKNGQSVMLFRLDEQEEALKRLNAIPLAAADGSPHKVMVYSRYVMTKGGAATLARQVERNLAAAMPVNYRPGHTYEVVPRTSQSVREEEFQALQMSDFALERVMTQALKRAADRGEMERKDSEEVREAIVQNIAEQLLGRGAGLYQVRRADYLIEGYDRTNATEKFESYVHGTAGMLSKAYYALRQFKHYETAPIEVRTWAAKYVSDSLRNMGAFDRLSGNARAFASLWFLGFNTMWMLINHTQPYAFGAAELSRYQGKTAAGDRQGGAFRRMFKAEKDLLLKKLSPEEREIWNDPRWRIQEKETVLAEMAGSDSGVAGKFSRGVQTAVHFSMAHGQKVEMLNRQMTILAAFRLFREQGLSYGSSLEKAFTVNSAVNIDMGRYNLPGYARGPVGRSLYTLGSYTQHALNWLYYRGTSGDTRDQKAILRLLFVMFLIGGVPAGAPGSDEIDKLIKLWFGYSPKLALRGFSRRTAKEYGSVGELLDGFVWHGVPGFFGASLTGSVQLRALVISNLIAGDDLAKSATGALGGLAQKLWMAGRQAARGDFARAAEYAAPTAVSNVLSAVRQSHGVESTHGKPVFYKGRQLAMTPGEATMRAIGMQPARTADISETRGLEKDLAADWNSRRQEALDEYRHTGKRNAIYKFNRDLRESQALGLVNPVRDIPQRGKPDRKATAWERQNGID